MAALTSPQSSSRNLSLGGGFSVPGSVADALGIGNSLSSFAAPGGNVSMSRSGGGSNALSGSFFSQPDLASQMANIFGGVQGRAGNNYMDFIMNPTGHPAFSNALSGLFGALQPSENAGRVSLMDMFRGAGNTASSTFGQKAMGLESEFMRNRQQMASQLLASLFPQISQALFNPLSQTDELLNALKLNASVSGSDQNASSFSTGVNAPSPAQNQADQVSRMTQEWSKFI